jgi:hypothetical protein
VLVGGYNAIASFSPTDGVVGLPGWLGGGLGLFSAIESGDVLAGFSSTLQLVDWATGVYVAAQAASAGTTAASTAGRAVAGSSFASTAVPFVNLVMAFESDNPATADLAQLPTYAELFQNGQVAADGHENIQAGDARIQHGGWDTEGLQIVLNKIHQLQPASNAPLWLAVA